MGLYSSIMDKLTEQHSFGFRKASDGISKLT